MKTALLILLFALSLVQYAGASGAPMLTITTAEQGISFRLQNINGRTEKTVQTLDKVETWLREVFTDKEQGNIVLIYSDDRTTFKTVSDVLRRVKAAGVEQYAVMIVSSDDVQTRVIGKTDKILLSR